MNHIPGNKRRASVGWITILLLPILGLQAAETEHAPDTPVYHTAGKKRVHVEGCRRLDGTAGKELMTLAEARKRGLPLCSRCPGSSTPGKGNPQAGSSGKGLPKSWVNPPRKSIETQVFVPDSRRPLVSIGADGTLQYNPYTDKGDRVLDWSHCGYRASEVPLPVVKTAIRLTPPPGKAKPVGKLAYPMGPDSRSTIQDAIDKVAAMRADARGARGAVLLGKGTWYVDGSLLVRSGVVLRGEGDGKDGTILIVRSAKGGGEALVVGDPKADIDHSESSRAARIGVDYLPTASTKLPLSSTAGLEVGDFVCIKKTVNQQWIEDIGCGERLRHIRGGKEGTKKRPWKPESYQFRHIRRITGLRGNTITLDAMLPQSFEKKHGGGEAYKVDIGELATHAGVESLRLVSNYDTTVQGNGKGTNYRNMDSGILVRGTSDSWVRNCTVMHVSFAAVKVGKQTRHVTVRDCKALQPVGPVTGGKRYPFAIAGGTLHLFYQCHTEDGRHCFAGGSRNMGPFAFVKCTSLRGGQSEPHHRWGCGFLFDHITTRDGSLAAINRGDSGSGHGWAAANTMIWNASARNVVVFDPETEGENNFAIGFRGPTLKDYSPKGVIYANTRSGYWGTEQQGAYYGHALMGNGYIESPTQPVKPDSLFVQQLIDRIGKARAEAVLADSF